MTYRDVGRVIGSGESCVGSADLTISHRCFLCSLHMESMQEQATLFQVGTSQNACRIAPYAMGSSSDEVPRDSRSLCFETKYLI